MIQHFADLYETNGKLIPFHIGFPGAQQLLQAELTVWKGLTVDTSREQLLLYGTGQETTVAVHHDEISDANICSFRTCFSRLFHDSNGQIPIQFCYTDERFNVDMQQIPAILHLPADIVIAHDQENTYICRRRT